MSKINFSLLTALAKLITIFIKSTLNMKNSSWYRYFFTSVFFSLAFLAVSLVPAFAVGGVGGEPLRPLDPQSPNWFIYNLDLGESYDDVLLAKNSSNKEWIVDIYPADSTPSSGGGFALKQKVEEMTAMGSWIKLSRNEVRLLPGQIVQIPFTITIPKDVDVGETAGAIMFERRDPYAKKSEDNSGGIKLSIRTGTRVYNTVPGEIIQKLELLDFELSSGRKMDGRKYYLAASRVENSGNVSVPAKYILTVVNGLTGSEIEKRESGFIVARDTVFKNNQELANLPTFGKINVKLDVYMQLKDGTEELVDSREASIIVLPLREILIVLLFAVALAAFIFWRRLKYSGEDWVSYKIKAGDNIIELAAKYKIDWKMLAKTNKIKSPYILIKGMSILVPSENAGKGNKADKVNKGKRK